MQDLFLVLHKNTLLPSSQATHFSAAKVSVHEEVQEVQVQTEMHAAAPAAQIQADWELEPLAPRWPAWWCPYQQWHRSRHLDQGSLESVNPSLWHYDHPGIGIGVGMRTPRASKAEQNQHGRVEIRRSQSQVRTRPVIPPPVHSGQGDFGKLSVVLCSEWEIEHTWQHMRQVSVCRSNVSSQTSPWPSRTAQMTATRWAWTVAAFVEL